jgi:response regulator RpfG family c-di-GMP phosphodiesterase
MSNLGGLDNGMLNFNIAAEPRAVHRILVVEDEVLIRWDVAETLRGEGYEVVEAASGDEAVDLMTSGMEFDHETCRVGGKL